MTMWAVDLAPPKIYSPKEDVSDNMLPDGRRLRVWFPNLRHPLAPARYALGAVWRQDDLVLPRDLIPFEDAIDLACWLVQFPSPVTSEGSDVRPD